MSFADGFQRGFGLIQDVKQSNDQMALERERLAETRRSNDLSYDINLRNAEIKDRLAMLEEAINPARIANVEAQTENLGARSELTREQAIGQNLDNYFDRKFVPREREAGIGLTESRTRYTDANTGLTEANTQGANARTAGQLIDNDINLQYGFDQAAANLDYTDSQTGFNEERTRGLRIGNDETLRQNKQVAGSEAMQLMVDMAEDVVLGSISPEQFRRAAELNKGTINDAGFIFDPSFDLTVNQLQADIANQNFDSDSGVAVLNAVGKPTNRYNIGTQVTEEFVNAPETLRDGTYKVVGSNFMSFESVNDGKAITGTILTAVEGQNGDVYLYTAPATKGRGPGDRQPLVMPVDKLIAGVAMVQEARRGMLANKNQIDRAAQVSRYGYGAEGQTLLDDVVKLKTDNFLTVAGNNPEAASPVAGMDMRSFTTAMDSDGNSLMQQYAKNAALHDYEGDLYTRDMYERHMAGVRAGEEAKAVQARIGPTPLTNKELEEVQILDFSRTRKGLDRVVQLIKQRREAEGIAVSGGAVTIGANNMVDLPRGRQELIERDNEE